MTALKGCSAFLSVYRRQLRNNVRGVFEMVDEDGGGVRNTPQAPPQNMNPVIPLRDCVVSQTLDIEECSFMMEKIGRK